MMRAATLMFLFALQGCADLGETAPPQPPRLPLEMLLNAPDTVQVAGRTFTLTTYLWRNLMPTIPPVRTPLLAIAYVDALDSAQLPGALSADAIWIIRGSDVWSAYFDSQPAPPGERRPNRIWSLPVEDRNGRRKFRWT